MLSMVYFHCKTRNAAKSVILGRKNLKKVPQNPGGTDICVCAVYIYYVYINTHTYSIYFENIYVSIFIYLIYKHNIFLKYIHACVYLYIHNKYTQYTLVYYANKKMIINIISFK